jgi:GWxTD domain-containing protein
MSLLRKPVPALLALAFLPASPARALDKESKAWLDGVAPLMLAEERKTFEGLKDKTDRLEFEKIFWARRDPDLDTPDNEYQAAYQKAFGEADIRFKTRSRPGSQTDCGRVFILLGEPSEMKKAGSGGAETPSATRTPEIWTYRDEHIAGGETNMPFDAECMGPSTDAFKGQLARLAEAKILHPNIDYRLDKDGHLTKLVDLLPKPTPAQALLKESRQDFEVATQASYLKMQDGGTALVGVVRGDAAGMPVNDLNGKKSVKLTVAAQALSEDGHVAAFAEQPENAEVRDGAFLASYRMVLKPGKYTLKAGALDPQAGKGSVASVPVQVPDFSRGELNASAMVLRDAEEIPEGSADPLNPYAAFTLANVRLIPYFGASFTKADAISVFYQYYDAKTDPATGKASAVGSVAIVKGARSLAKAPDQTFDSVVGGNLVGPIPLKDFQPGSYTAQVRIMDNVAKREILREVAFDVKP